MDKKTGVTLFWAGGLLAGPMAHIAAKHGLNYGWCIMAWQVMYLLGMWWAVTHDD